MAKFIGRRLIYLLPVLLAVTLLTFLIASLLPGDLAYTILGDQATPEKVEALRAQMGLDRPIWERYLLWLGHALQGDLGRSFRTGEMVSAGRPVLALLPPGNLKVRFFVSEAMLPQIRIDDVVNVHCDGCPSGLTAKVSFIARSSEFTPPVIYSLEERSKLVFLVEARPEQPDKLRVGQPVSVAVTLREAAK